MDLKILTELKQYIGQYRGDSLRNILENPKKYDLSPPYQRDNVWGNDYKISLIALIAADLPVAPIHLVKKWKSNKYEDKDSEYYVLDGKQRLSAIFDFCNDEFKIPLPLENGKQKEFTYADICGAAKDEKNKFHNECKKFYNDFISSNLIIAKHGENKQMPWSKQIYLFENINHSKSLTKHEEFLSKYPMTRLLSDFWFKKYLPKTSKFINDNNRVNKRGKGVVLKYRILSALFGGSINSRKFDKLKLFNDNCHRKNGKLNQFCEEMNKKVDFWLEKENDTYLFTRPDDAENKFKDENWLKIVETSKKFDKIFNIFCKINSKYKNSLMYFTLYILEKNEQKIFTNYFLDKNKETFIDIYKKYIEHTAAKTQDADADENKVRRADTTRGAEYHYNYINDLFIDSKLDLGEKEKKPSQEQRAMCLKNSNNKCPICYNKENLEIDHKYGAKLSSEEEYITLCSYCNKIKSGKTEKELLSTTNLENKDNWELFYHNSNELLSKCFIED